MTRSNRTTPLVLPIAFGLLLGACAPGASPAVSPEGAATPSSPASASIPPAPTASPIGSAAACPVAEQTGGLPSARLVDLSVASTPTHDLLTFVFAPSAPGPGGVPKGTLSVAQPPFSFAGSGQAIVLLGHHAVQLRFSAMTIADDSGGATYHGPTDVKPRLPALREAIQFDASEGIVAWYVGYDGPGCVTLVREGTNVTVMIAHPEAPAG